MSEVSVDTWGETRHRRFGRLGKWRNPIGLVGAAIVLFNVFVAVLGP